ncbi:uncharacterized protein FOMMEDRAFT_143938 [Fomitiporia mediterranea MF3/22]|uniref:uncharacterized protein n=1 Tax=Fomitiporia mediterranea (strain MF3/22) TaxID=694068 RepID=UPI0004408134|nr:uncharacterized protein FOMMEDRAFT_143938 [Fomitiporia mediterranea MF3/22]EJD07598.1 hypothetical protein FOMMEDRAFT_143938 [Fomitiporia mediterranea MF3/22]
MGDLSLDPSRLQERLQAEFCPPLDTTIVLALISDHITGEKPTETILKTLREELSVLAASATVDQDDLANTLNEVYLFAPSASTEDSRDADSVFSQRVFETNSSSGSSMTQPREGAQMTYPRTALDFLRASFPHMPLETLRTYLDVSDADMEQIVEELLSKEFIRELEEGGLDDEALDEELEKWTVVSKKPKGAARSTTVNKKRKPRRKTIAINDVRQKQHARPESQFRSTSDPWNQLASMSSYLETLLLHPASFFQSYFHKPEYPSPCIALRAALDAIAHQSTTKTSSADVEQDRTTALFNLLELVRDHPDFDFDNLDSETRAQLCSDAELSLSAASGSPDVAFDVLVLLHDLEVDNERMQEMGVYHSPASPLTNTPVSSPGVNLQSCNSKAVAWTATSPASPLPSGSSVPISATLSSSNVSDQRPSPAPSESSWQVVTPARRKPPAIHPLAAHIPAYNPHNVPRRKKARSIHSSLTNPNSPTSPTSNTTKRWKPGPRSRGDATMGGYRSRIEACNARRDDALRTASRHWSRGGARGHGGEVAFFYAQEAQRHQAEAQQLRLDALRELIDGRRFASTDSDTIDVHYCTTNEALSIVREVLEEGWVSSARPLHVVTGRGNHSTGGVAVLGPAVKKALEQDDWAVGKWDGGITVRGRIR